MASSEKIAEELIPPAEIGNSENNTVSHHTGRRGWNPFTNFHLVVEHQPSSFAPNSKWSNKDLDPILPQNRTWRTYNYVAYWASDAFVVSIWQMASAFLASGLNWQQSLGAVALGFVLIAIPITLQGTMGARLNIPFPILVRGSFGMYLSYFCIVSRSILAMFWFGISTTTGGTLTVQCIRAIWPQFRNISNYLPASANITTQGMIGYVVFFVFQFPFLLIPGEKVRWFFVIKAIVVPIAFLAVMCWSMHAVGGFASSPIAEQEATISGSALGWAFMNALNASLGTYCTLGVNVADFTRYAKTPKAQYIQVFIIPVVFILVSFFGIATTSASRVLYGAYLWNPAEIFAQWSNRAAVFFASAAFAISIIGTNISANSISAAVDLMTLCPKYINLRRGQILAAFIGGWAFVPWNILASATAFLNFMAGYTIWLGPITSIMIAEYWIVKREKVNVPELYRPHGMYHYWNGVNWRALFALCVGFAPVLPGLINSITPSISIAVGAQHLYALSYLYSFFVAMAVYTVTSKIWPARESYPEKNVHSDDVGYGVYTETSDHSPS